MLQVQMLLCLKSVFSLVKNKRRDPNINCIESISIVVKLLQISTLNDFLVNETRDRQEDLFSN